MKKINLLICFIIISIIISAQNVGVGTTTPAEKLHVAGNIKADTIKPDAIKLTPNAGAGKLLTSDAEGNASWQTMVAAASNSGSIGFGVWGDCATNGNISGYNPIVDSTGAASDNFGKSVSISGDYAIVGAYADDGVLGADQGSASIFQYNGTNWVLMEKLTDASGAANANFGISVSISGDYAIVGAYYDWVFGANQGSASIFQYNGTNWVLMDKITDANGSFDDNFGKSVSISGNYAIVGAQNDDGTAGANQGSASIFQYNGTNWVLMEKITDATGAAHDFFGCSVSISGDYAIVGAYGDGAPGLTSLQGSASIFQYNGTNWVLMQRITDATGTSNDEFGSSVSISGIYAIVGAWVDDVGNNENQGSASIFQYNGSTWPMMNKITGVNGEAYDFFGGSVSISGNYAIVGADLDNVSINSNEGSASIYQRVGLGWVKLQFVTDPAGDSFDLFGRTTAIDGINKRFLIGASGYAPDSGKVVFGKIN